MFARIGLAATIAVLWVGSMLGASGSTLGAFSAATINTITFISDAPLPAPLVTSISPANSATRVPKLSRVFITFSESMDLVRTPNAVQVQQVSGGTCTPAKPCAVAGAFSWPSPSMLMFIPASPLAIPFVSFQVTVGKGAISSSGNGSIAMNTPVSSGFSTGDGTETIPGPTVISSAPTGVVPPKTAIQLTFSQPMDVASTEGAFLLQQTSGLSGTTPCSSDKPCPVPITAKGFSWGGAAGTILSYVPAPDLAGANYRVTEQTAALSLYGANLSPGTPATNVFSFAIGGAPVGPPDAPAIISPVGETWTGASTFTITGTTKQPNLLIEALNADGHLAASLQLDGGSTSFSLPVPVAEGLNKMTVQASNAFYHSVNNPVVVLNRDDRTTTVDPLAAIPDSDQIELRVPYHGDSDANSYATFGCVVGGAAGGAACPTTPPAKVPGANGLFDYVFTGLKVSTTYTVQADIFDSDQVTCVAPWTAVSPTHCSQSMTLATTPLSASGGAIISLAVTPNDGPASTNGLLATAAPQKEAFKVSYNCGFSCTKASTVLLSLDNSSSTRVATICSASAAPDAGHQAKTTILWDGKDSGGALLPDGSYPYTLKVFDDGACGATAGSHFVASHTGDVVKVANASSLAVVPSVTSFTAGTPVEIDAKVKDSAGANVADGDSNVDPATGASVLLTAAGSVSNAGLSFTGGSTVNGIPQVTAIIGAAGQGCVASIGTGQACAQINLAPSINFAQYVTITAGINSQGAKSLVVGQVVVPNPPQPPTNVTLTPGSIVVSWTKSVTQNVAGYKILLGKAPGQYDRTIDAGNVTSYHITDVDPGVTYYVQVQAYTADGMTSSPPAGAPGAGDSSITTPGTSTPTPTLTPTSTPTVNGTPAGCSGTPTSTPASGGATSTPAPTCTPLPTATATATVTATATGSTTPAATGTVTVTVTPGGPTTTATATATAGASPTATTAPAPTNTVAATNTPTRTPTRTSTPTPTRTP